ncbi:fumarylacetoacetate hydrolase family protein [Moraxella haemolytica]|uniref:fumarylacetoacetate hydrolase family protein n=1 Tax=Moraxella TaxID=475 RepID=UPI002542C837|nr:fumarylacetoacetate hydrolase family protein [Moraxella sp. ZY171148]WII94462.1 fumarylacetoacetate hydrolase family protein [Moraxella sp. ZY171148]
MQVNAPAEQTTINTQKTKTKPMPTITLNNQTHTINNIYCIGRSYVEHIHELGNAMPDEPVVFLKPTSSIVAGNTLSLPDFSNSIHHEVELVLLIGDDKQIIGVAVGLDLTARDVQAICKEKGLPWTKAKGFKNACWLSDFQPFINKTYHLSLTVNDEIRQDDDTNKMMYSFEYLVDYLDTLYGLNAGDIIMTGTPKGVSQLKTGDKVIASLDGLAFEILVK